MNCQKSLWLYVHKKEEREVDEAIQAICDRGTNAGELARDYFPNGELAVLEDYPCFESAKRTQEFIKQGVETIYEATFVYNDTLVAVDMLHKKNGKWNLYEVKSTNRVKPEHYKDVAVQYYVVNGSGLDLEDAFLMHFNREYVRQGKIEVNKLFLPESVMSGIIPIQNDIPINLSLLKQMLKGEEPNIKMGYQCTSPYQCDFYDYCMNLLPDNNEITPELSSIPEIKESDVKTYVDSIEYPLCHLDFETIMPGIPMFNQSRPYQQIPFQYSLHFQETKNSEIKHTSYLAESNINVDPRERLIKQMIHETKNAKTIFVYNISFERTRISEMSRDFPEYSIELENIIERLVDLIIPFRRKYYRTETMEGSSSIKKVLPALCPELSYNDLEIGNGMDASNSFLDLYFSEDKTHIAETREHLLKYCHLDTLAMVKLFELLQKV